MKKVFLLKLLELNSLLTFDNGTIKHFTTWKKFGKEERFVLNGVKG